MVLFDFLFGSKTPPNVDVVPDRIWLTNDAKFAGLAKEVDNRLKSDTLAVLLVAHFPDVLTRLEELAAERTSDAPVKVVPATNLDAELAASLHVDQWAFIDIIVAERHPLRSVDDRLEQFAGTLPCRCRLAHHLSLDDPVMKIFANDFVRRVLDQLGMPENEAIQSNMVSRSIKKAQQKIEGRAFGNREAASAAEWIEKNCPELAGEA